MRLVVALFCLSTTLNAAQKKYPAPKAPPVRVATPKGFNPIWLDPVNPHYFRFRNRTTVLVSSGQQAPGIGDEKYLDSLVESRLNYARFRADASPAWQMKDGKYDLAAWDEAYFERLKHFVAEADKRGIVVEITLFSVQYGSGRGGYGTWNSNPLNSDNNLNKTGAVNWDRYNTLDNAPLVAAQDALAKRIISAVSGFENVYYEICNEPQFSGATAKETAAWSDHILATIKDAERKAPGPHLIATGDGGQVLTFHHASASVIPLHWAAKKPVALDQAPAACNGVARRAEAWSFLLSGGAVYNHPGDCLETRYQLSILQAFLRRFDLAAMQPDPEAVRQWPLGASDAYVLADANRSYAVYLRSAESKLRQSVLIFDLPAGTYQAEWLNPRTGDEDKADPQQHKGGLFRLVTPEYTDDLALRFTAVRLPAVNRPATSTRPR